MNEQNRRALTFGGLGLLALVVAVLVVVALFRPSAGSGESHPSPARASQTAPSAHPSPTQSADTFIPVPSGRMLAISEGTLWRATAGSCVEGVAPTVERSDDSGATWVPVSFGTHDVRQVTWIGGFADGQLDLVAASGEACEEIGLRTFTRGEFWAENDTLLTNTTRVTATGTLVSPQGDGTAPCDDVYDVHDGNEVAVALCSGEAFVRTANGWSTTNVSQAAATAVADGAAYIAHLDDSCAGLAIERVADGATERLFCAEGLDDGAATALTLSQAQLMAWNGDLVRAFAL